MAFTFPEDKNDFTAPNGVTYAWDGVKWRTKTFKADESALEDYVKTVEFTADQGRQDAEISTIEFKLDTLVGLQFKGLYTFKIDADCEAAYLACMVAAGADNTAIQNCTRDQVACENGKVSSGTFEGVDPDGQFDNLAAIVIHKMSKDGEELEWVSLLKTGDYLEIDHQGAGGLDKQNYGLYRVAADPVEAANASGEAVFDIELEFLQGAGVLVADEDYEIRGINQAEGVNPEELGDFLLKEEAANTYALKTHTHSYNDLTDKPTIPSSYSLPTATTSTKGGVTSATNSGTYVPCTKMANSGTTIGVVESTNSAKGVNYKGQACVTSSSTPDTSSYRQGALIFSTSTNSLYIRT